MAFTCSRATIRQRCSTASRSTSAARTRTSCASRPTASASLSTRTKARSSSSARRRSCARSRRTSTSSPRSTSTTATEAAQSAAPRPTGGRAHALGARLSARRPRHEPRGDARGRDGAALLRQPGRELLHRRRGAHVLELQARGRRQGAERARGSSRLGESRFRARDARHRAPLHVSLAGVAGAPARRRRRAQARSLSRALRGSRRERIHPQFLQEIPRPQPGARARIAA